VRFEKRNHAPTLESSHERSVWLRQMRFKPTGGLWCKSTVYGLNGHRSNFVIALSLGAYEHAI
jgi:hypothetical protein